MSTKRIFGMVLAGGEGKRLMPLTADRAKPAVPFGGSYRLIDFALSNLINSGVRRIVVLTQYKSHSLDRHISQTWRMSPLLGSYSLGASTAETWQKVVLGQRRRHPAKHEPSQ
jgi:glucose-1-phosphate adenylyltransferase